MSRRTTRFAVVFAAVSPALFAVGCGSKSKSPNLACSAPVATKWDSDADLLTDIQEMALGTDPTKADSDADGFSDYAEVAAGTDPMSAASKPSGAVASVKQVANANELIGGPAAQGVVGDWLIMNDKVRGIVQDSTRTQQQLGTFGGNLIDADVVRNGATPDNDTVGMIIPLIALGSTSHPNKVVIVNDGADGGPAILRTCGPADIYEYLDIHATFTEFGFNLNYDTNELFPHEISNDFVLAPGSRTIEVITTIGNRGKAIYEPIGDVIDSGAAQEIFNTNSIGFGQAGFANLTQLQPPTQFLGFLSPGSAWGYANDYDPNVSITVAGVTVLQAGFNSLFDIVGSNPESGDKPGMFLLPHNGRFSYRRGITVTDGTGGIDPMAQTYYQRHKPTAKPHSGTVMDGTGPVAGARIVALTASATPEQNALPQNSTESDAAGNYTLNLVPGSYYILADMGGRPFPTFSGAGVTTEAIQTKYTQNTLDAAKVTFSASEAAPDVTFTAGGALAVHVTEAITGAQIPTRITVVGSDPSPGDSIFRDQKEKVSSAIAANVLSRTGDSVLAIEPGSYTVYADHGIEFSIDSAGVAVVAGGAPSLANLSIGRVIDTTGWISADFHVHMMNSPDSPVPLADRALNAAAEGLDVIVTTDHDYITDLTPTIAAMGLGSSMTSVPGEEITSWDMGHFNSWPLMQDLTHPTDGGAFKWSGAGNGNPISNKTVKEIFEGIDAKYDGTQVKQVNHPRGGNGAMGGFILQQYYSAIELDTATLKSKKDPTFLRVPPPAGSTADDTGLFYKGFDAQEVQNGFDDAATRNSDLNDLLTFLNHGMTVVATGNSDSHKVFSNQLGYPRNYVKMSDDVPANLGANTEEFATSMVGGHAFFSQGPFLKVTATGLTPGEAGDLIRPKANNTVDLAVTVEFPTWVGVDTMHVYMNTPNTATPFDLDGNTTAPAALQGTAGTIDIRPYLTLQTAPSGKNFWRAILPTRVITTPTANDAWILLDFTGTQPGTRSLFPIIPAGTSDATGAHPYSIYNAIFIDVNGNGTFDAPGVSFNAAYHPPKAEPLKRFGSPSEMTPDIRAQFEAVTKGACHGESTNGAKGQLERPE